MGETGSVLRCGGFEPGRVVEFGLDPGDLAGHGCRVQAGDRGGTAHGVGESIRGAVETSGWAVSENLAVEWRARREL